VKFLKAHSFFAPSILNGNAHGHIPSNVLNVGANSDGGAKRVAKQKPELKGVVKLEQTALPRV
jgi:hypothetical protein